MTDDDKNRQSGPVEELICSLRAWLNVAQPSHLRNQLVMLETGLYGSPLVDWL